MTLPSGEQWAVCRAVCSLCWRWQHHLTWSSVPPSPLTTFQTRLWLSYLSARCLVLLQQLLSLWSQGTWTRAAAKATPFRIPQGPLIVIRKVFGRGLVPSQATANKSPTPINEHTARECMCEGFLCSCYWCMYVNTTHLIWRNHLVLRQQ